MAAASEPSAQQSGIDNVPGVPEAMCRPQRLGPRQPACRTLGRDRPRSRSTSALRSGRTHRRWQHRAAQWTSTPTADLR